MSFSQFGFFVILWNKRRLVPQTKLFFFKTKSTKMRRWISCQMSFAVKQTPAWRRRPEWRERGGLSFIAGSHVDVFKGGSGGLWRHQQDAPRQWGEKKIDDDVCSDLRLPSSAKWPYFRDREQILLINSFFNISSSVPLINWTTDRPSLVSVSTFLVYYMFTLNT